MYASLIDLLEEGFQSSAQLEKDQEFLTTHVFVGLTERNTGFDSELIPHFSPADFLRVIDRCVHHGVEIIGIEAFAEGKELVEIEISPEPGYGWARHLTRRYLSDGDITLCASYRVRPWNPDQDSRGRDMSGLSCNSRPRFTGREPTAETGTFTDARTDRSQ